MKPAFCCSCGSSDIGRAPSRDLLLSFDEKRKELENVCSELNKVYCSFADLKERYDELMTYWAQQKRRGYISKEEYEELAKKYSGFQGK